MNLIFFSAPTSRIIIAKNSLKMFRSTGECLKVKFVPLNKRFYSQHRFDHLLKTFILNFCPAWRKLTAQRLL